MPIGREALVLARSRLGAGRLGCRQWRYRRFAREPRVFDGLGFAATGFIPSLVGFSGHKTRRWGGFLGLRGTWDRFR
jgi:hypothetical protein